RVRRHLVLQARHRYLVRVAAAALSAVAAGWATFPVAPDEGKIGCLEVDTMTETGASFAGRKKFEGPGGTPGGAPEVLVGLIMIAVGVYIVFDHVTVHTSFWRFWGGPNTSFGLTLLPLLGGIGVLFFNGRSVLGWVLTVGGITLILTGV